MASSATPLMEQPWTTTGPTKFDTNGHLFQQISFAVMAVIIAIGSVGNSIVLYVYSQKKDRQTANIFILSLAITDTVACTLVIPMTIGMEIVKFRTNLLVCKLYYLLNASGFPFSCMLMTAIAVDRYFCICRPFLRVITLPRARAIVLALGSVAVTLGVTTSAFCSGVVAETGPNGSWQHAGYGYCKEINDMKSLNATDINISDASLAFYNVFQKVHVSLFIICIAVVFVLYISIYRSVLAMRRKRRELKGQSARGGRGPTGASEAGTSELQDRLLPPTAAAPDVVTSTAAGGCSNSSPCRARFAEPSGTDRGDNDEDHDDKNADGAASGSAGPGSASAGPSSASSAELLKRRRKSMKLAKDSDTLQNLKTAAMLFVVTIVFVCTFVPAALMSQRLLDFNMIIFYMYYLTHATNPLIYCFMNQNFRDDLQRIFCHGGPQRGGVGGGTSAGGSQRQPPAGTASTSWQR